ncbi:MULTISPECIES: hypothetical protein [Kamptonema]|uniref:hypothetical protein n=1 Tax=Kamptonema TaxID=1501433 RepID=UPI0001DACF14|nr:MULTISPECIES: hypothetical protein [Kamptonema]CBN56400.1 hypothetical protein OSCI_3010004 [Kamptonema sp. PCC 6506]
MASKQAIAPTLAGSTPILGLNDSQLSTATIIPLFCRLVTEEKYPSQQSRGYQP